MKTFFKILSLLLVAQSGILSAQEEKPTEIKKENKKVVVIQKQDKDGKITEERFETENGEFSPEAKQKMKELKMDMKESEDGENITIEISEERTSEHKKGSGPAWVRKGKQGKKGFASPPEVRREIMERQMQKKQNAPENKAVLGVEIDDTRYGVRIAEIISGSAAESSALRRGDVILKINDSYIFSADGLLEALHPFNPGEKVKVRYLRDGKEKSTSVVLKSNS